MDSAANALTPALRAQIFDAGYYPEVVSDAVARAIGDDAVLAHLVHHEATFTSEEVLRHLTVLVLTEARLIVGHTDEQSDRPDQGATAITSTEVIPLRQVSAVSLTRVIQNPSRFKVAEEAHRSVVETWLTLGWGTMRRVDLEPAGCADPECDADHGFSGTLVNDDITVRMSPTADGVDKVAELVEFGTRLQRAVGR
ncbi:DUF5998 family protein [Aestuariimicrobium sp. T2.26MG-19.2B]|uniref:DUF5998 family protein n=1 Tax=Aestuariimicrobium sp. T2.26MG-19.2B TaxID=3040679 RepID=UPI00247789E3|nr:DUF5998 family protein [Aestuariimicrobium sp. T2.26MG-19.2B]CAI9408705.1 hypothetical protein AESSP_02081 [Aestuariimicrobium sp. T2.26MG-19.2B]